MKQGVIVDKEYKKDSEAGSGSLYIPILGDLFPKLFGQEMNPIDKYYFIVRIDALYKYEVSKDLFDKATVGDEVIIDIDRYGMPDLKLLKE